MGGEAEVGLPTLLLKLSRTLFYGKIKKTIFDPGLRRQ